MLEFIVLGQIPGTPFQITLAWFVFAVLGVLIWADIKFHVHKSLAAPAKKSRKTTSKARPSRAKA